MNASIDNSELRDKVTGIVINNPGVLYHELVEAAKYTTDGQESSQLEMVDNLASLIEEYVKQAQDKILDDIYKQIPPTIAPGKTDHQWKKDVQKLVEYVATYGESQPLNERSE